MEQPAGIFFSLFSRRTAEGRFSFSKAGRIEITRNHIPIVTVLPAKTLSGRRKGTKSYRETGGGTHMKINPAAAYQAYNKVTEHNHSTPRRPELRVQAPAQRAGNTDQIQISPEATRQREVEQLTQSILAEIREPASPQRLDSLRTAVQNHTYHVPTVDLVDAVMKQWFVA